MNELGNMERIKADFSVGKLFPGSSLKGFGHIHRDVFDGLWLPLMGHKVHLEGLEGCCLSPLDGANNTAGDGVVEDRQIAESLADMFLIYSQSLHSLIGGAFAGRLHMGIDSAPDAILGDSKHLGDGRDRELLGESQNQCVHQESEATAWACPGDFGLSHLIAMPTFHARQRGMQKRLVLKEMKMLPGPLGSIMNRLIGLGTDRTAQAFHFAGKIKMDLSFLRLKANIRYFPRLLETQGGRKRGLSIPWDSKLIEGSEGPLDYANSHSKRKSARSDAGSSVF